jgi:predicted transposase YbfD/YdcC
MAKKSAKIQEIRGMLRVVSRADIENISIEPMVEMRGQFALIPDKRFQPYVEYQLADIVMITLLAVMSGANEWVEIGIFARAKEGWLRSFLSLPDKVPSHDTIQRVVSVIDSRYLYSLTLNFLIVRIEILSDTAWALRLKADGGKDEGEEGPRIVAFDGKESIGSKRKKTDRDAVKAMQTVSAYSTDYGLCLSEAVIEEKTNEIPTVQTLLEVTAVKGCIVTWDALNTQKDTVAKVIKKGGDYVGALKGNQESLYLDVKEYFEDAELCLRLEKKEGCYLKTSEKEQSGIAAREYYLTEDIKWLAGRKAWAGLKAIGCVRRTLEKFSKETKVETRYFISSVTDIKDFAKAVRGHWGIENKIHCPLDYTFRDDQNTTMAKNGAQNLQTMKRVALAILGMAQTFFKMSIKNIRHNLGWDFEKQIEEVFKLLNAEALEALLLPKPGNALVKQGNG